MNRAATAATKVTRIQFYEGLLNAKGIALEPATVEQLQDVCVDAEGLTEKMASVYITARKAGIASRYLGGKCRLNLFMPKYEAVRFAQKAMR